MRIEADDNTVGVVGILALAALLCWAIFNARACDVNQRLQNTERCKAAIAAQQYPVTVDRVCNGM